MQVKEARGMSVVFIGFYICCLPTAIFPTIVTLNVGSLTASTALLHHKCTGEPFSSDRYSNFLHEQSLSNGHIFCLLSFPGAK